MEANSPPRRSESLLDFVDSRLADRNITMSEFADALGRPRRSLYDQLGTPTLDFLEEVSAFFDSDTKELAARFLVRSEQRSHELRELKELGEFSATFNTKALRAIGVLRKRTGLRQKHESILGILKAGSMAEVKCRFPRRTFYSSLKRKSSDQAINWLLATVTKRVEEKDAPYRFDPGRLERIAANLMLLPAERLDGFVTLQDQLQLAGVHFLVLPKIPNAGIRGLSYIDENDQHVIVVVEQSYWDSFWFAVAHEIGHMVLHRNELRSGVNVALDHPDGNDQIEHEADEFARLALIRKIDLDHALSVYRSPTTITQMAEAEGVDPAILFGQLAYRQQEYRFYSPYRPKFRDIVPGEGTWSDELELVTHSDEGGTDD